MRFSGGCRYAFGCQQSGYAARRFTSHEKRVNPLYDHRFSFDDLRDVIFAFLVTEEVFVCYGVYSNTEDIIETNGDGEILWDKTINETFTLISHNKPYYPEIRTLRRVIDDFDFFKKLHECVLTICTKELRDADVLDLFDIYGVDISDEHIADFGDRDYILDRIRKEIDIQFNTHKQRLLKAIYAFISHYGSLDDLDCFSMFGTNSFNLVWERVCADIMDNQLQKPIGALQLPIPLDAKYERQTLLIDLIEKPTWTAFGRGEPYPIQADATLIPDLVSIYRKGDECQFIIFDAKYYNLQLEGGKPLRGQPGVESITKQYLYQLEFADFVSAHEFTTVRNCFLFPTDGDEIVIKGTATMRVLSELGLNEIQVRCLPARVAYDHYLAGSRFDIANLIL